MCKEMMEKEKKEYQANDEIKTFEEVVKEF